MQRYDYFTNYSREVDMISIMVFAQMDIDRGKSGMETSIISKLNLNYNYCDEGE